MALFYRIIDVGLKTYVTYTSTCLYPNTFNYAQLESFILDRFVNFGDNFEAPNRFVLNGFIVNDIPFCIHRVKYLNNQIDFEHTYLSVVGFSNANLDSLVCFKNLSSDNKYGSNHLRTQVHLLKFYIKNQWAIETIEQMNKGNKRIYFQIPLANLHDIVF